MLPVDKMGAETAIDTFRGEFSFLGTIVGPGAPVANHLWQEIVRQIADKQLNFSQQNTK